VIVRQVVAVAAVIAARPAAADPGDLALGLYIGAPGQGSGAPIGPYHVPGGIVARYELAAWRDITPAIAGGLGTPIAGVGASAWAGLELRIAPIRRLALYAAPGLRTGFVGPGYYARHSNVFVGYEYNYAGPWTVAPRLPIGIATPIGRTEMYLEGVVEAPLWPSPEAIFGAGIGVRIRL
jgi:hypothetical protein